MTKNEIIEALKASAQPYDDFYISDEVSQAMDNFPQPFELVEPILEIIGTNPTVEFGMPGDLVRYVEQFSNKGYEELLVQSVKNTPTPHNIWMLHRCYNNPNDTRKDIYRELINNLKNADTTPEEVKTAIGIYDWK